MTARARRFWTRRAFSLVELIVALGIVGIMVGLLLPAVQTVRESANRLGCTSNLRQIGLACHNYESALGTLPPAYGSLRRGKLGGPPSQGDAMINWPVLILPYIEQEPLWEHTLAAYGFDVSAAHNPPHVGLATVIPIYVCPSDPRLGSPITDDEGYTAAYWSYEGVAGGTRADGAMQALRGSRFADITDGTSQTLLVGERPAPGRHLAGSWYTMEDANTAWAFDDWAGVGRMPYLTVFWANPVGRCQGPFAFGPGRVENPCDGDHFWSMHPGGANFLFADGAVHFLGYGTSPTVMIALGTRAGGEVVDSAY